jgi:hypothetical protein
MKKERSAMTASPYTPPFSLQSSCVLSEDYFLTDQVIMNSSDVVRPFARADGTVEALLLSGGVVSHLSRSAAATSGWTCTTLPGSAKYPLTDVADVAVATGSDGTVWALALRTLDVGGENATMYVLATLGSSGIWDYVYEYPMPFGLRGLQSGLDTNGDVYFYAFYTGSTNTMLAPDGSFALWQPHSTYSATINASLAGLDMVDARLFSDPVQHQSSVFCLTSQQIAEWHPQIGGSTFDRDPVGQITGVAALLWTGWVTYPTLPGAFPGYAYQMQSGDIFFSTPESDTLGDAGIGSAGSALGQDKVAVWQDGGLFGFAMLLGDTVTVISEYGNPGDVPLDVTNPIPLQPDVTAVFSQPADATRGTLFVVLADATLNVLAKDPAAGWSLVPILQDGATLQELDTWRVQLSVTDANGAAVAGAQLDVTADRPAGAWQANQSTLLGPGNPATFTADARGRVTFATPAVELDAPQLSVQVVSGDTAVEDASPLMVSPDSDVHAFLAGTGPLNDLGPLTGASLLTATKADRSPLCPVLASVPSGQQAQAADAVVAAVGQCVKAGQGVTPGPDDARSWTLDLTGSAPTYTSSVELTSTDHLQSLSGWWDSVENDADSFFHGVRHDAVQVATCTANWVQDEATGAWHWAVSLAVTVEKEIIGAADYVISDMKSAIHAVTGFFQALGADIGDIITWLRQNIGELIAEAGQNARMVQEWLAQLPAIATAKLTEYGQLADGFFAGLETAIDEKIDTLVMPGLKQQTFGSPTPTTPPAVIDVEKFLCGIQHNWLLDKIESFFVGDTAAQLGNDDFQNAFDKLAAAVQDGVQVVMDIGELLWTGLQEPFASSGSAQQTQLAEFFGLLKQAVHDLLAFADAVVQALIAVAEAAMDELDNMLSHGFEDIPLVSALLERFGVSTTMNVAHVVSLVLMYPATLANRIKNGSDSTLFPAVTAARDGGTVADAQADWAFGLGLSAAVGQGIWGAADAVGDLQRVEGKEPSGVIGWIDIAAPLVLAILGWPGTPAGPPFANPIDGSGPDGAMIWPSWLLGLVPPIVGLCGQFADYKPPAAVEVTDDAPEDWPEIGQYFTMAAAIASTIVGSIYNFQTSDNPFTQAAGIVSNVSNVIAPFATKTLAETTDGGSEIIKFFVDYFCNLGAAGLMGAALSGA